MQYHATEEPLKDRRQTSQKIKSLVREFYTDLDLIKIPVGSALLPLSSLPFDKYFDYVRNIPYKRDNVPIEKIGRPAWIMEKRPLNADCKKKAIMIAAWLEYHKIPWRLIGSSSRRDLSIHHIFPQAHENGQWINVDATYSEYRIAQQKTVTAKEIL